MPVGAVLSPTLSSLGRWPLSGCFPHINGTSGPKLFQKTHLNFWFLSTSFPYSGLWGYCSVFESNWTFLGLKNYDHGKLNGHSQPVTLRFLSRKLMNNTDHRGSVLVKSSLYVHRWDGGKERQNKREVKLIWESEKERKERERRDREYKNTKLYSRRSSIWGTVKPQTSGLGLFKELYCRNWGEVWEGAQDGSLVDLTGFSGHTCISELTFSTLNFNS